MSSDEFISNASVAEDNSLYPDVLTLERPDSITETRPGYSSTEYQQYSSTEYQQQTSCVSTCVPWISAEEEGREYAYLSRDSSDQTLQSGSEVRASSNCSQYGDSSFTLACESYDNNWRKSSLGESDILEDITTWSPETMRATALAIQASTKDEGESSVWERSFSNDLCSGISADLGKELLPLEFGRKEENFILSGPTESRHSPISKTTQWKRTPKLYQLPPQEDKDLEFRRLRALREHEYREEQDRKQRRLTINLKELEAQVAKLKIKKVNLQASINYLEREKSKLESGVSMD